MSTTRYLVAYDISTRSKSGQARLQKVGKVCAGYGMRVQLSVWECELSQVAKMRLVRALLDVISVRSDSIRIYRLSGEAEAYGVALQLSLDDLLLI